MQIQCHNCHNPMTVNPQGGQFKCPSCRAVNAVGGHIQPRYAPLAQQVRPQRAMPPNPKSDNRRVVVIGAFVILGGGAIFAQWMGIALGVAILAWAIAGAMGKIKGPVALIFPESVRKVGLAAVGIGLGSFVTMCGAIGTTAAAEDAELAAEAAKNKEERETAAAIENEKREADEAVAKAADEAELRGKAGKTATEYRAALDTVEALIAEGKWVEAEAEAKAKEMGSLADYKQLNPVPKEILAVISRQDALTLKLDAARTGRETVAWIETAEGVVSDKASCQTQNDVEAAREQVEGLQESDANYTKVQELNTKLDECLKNMPPPSKWIYNKRDDAMGGSVSTATVESTNSFKFDFPYRGTQHATLTIRKEKGMDVLLSIEQGQFMCTLGCSFMVRFDDEKSVRWRATGASDHSTTTVFLRRESKFVKALSKTNVLRIEAQFYQAGSRVLEFPVDRLDRRRLK